MSEQTLIWLLISFITITDSIALLIQDMVLEWDAELRKLVLLGSFFTIARLLHWLQKAEAARLVTALVQALTFAHVGTIMTYALMAASPFPMADPLFESADVALGFNWLAWFRWVDEHHIIHFILFCAYSSMIPQALVLITMFCYAAPERVEEFYVAAILSMIIVFPFIYFLPSIGAFAPHGVKGSNWEGDILTMRSHANHVIRPTEGIVTFPSYHAVLGVLLSNMTRGRSRFFIASLMLNAVMIVSVMNIGAHYFVDAIGGVVVGAVALTTTHYLLRLCSRKGYGRDEEQLIHPLRT